MKRREFIAASAVASTSLLATSQSTGAETRSQPISEPFMAESNNQDEPRFKKAVKIGMVNVEGDLTTKFKLLKELGFDGVELNSPGGPAEETVKKAIEESGLPVHGVVDSIHWNKTLSHPDESVRKEGVDGLLTAIKASKAYGGTSVLLVPGRVNKEATYEQCWERSIPEIKKALPLAEELEIDILFENVWNDFLTDPDETAKYIDSFESDRVGAYYDVGNSVRYANPVIWVRTLGHRIKKLDIKEFDLALAKKENDIWKGFRSKLLEGSTGWYDVIRELKKLDFKGWGTAEIPGGGKERLTEIAERMDRIFAL